MVASLPQSGNTFVATNLVYSMTNGEASTALVIGAPVYVSAAGTVKRARANAKSTSVMCGLCFDTSIAAGDAGNIVSNGIVAATTGQWDTVAGTSGGLTANTIYFLSTSNAGKISSTVPSGSGNLRVVVGLALSTTQLLLFLDLPTLL